MDGVWMWQQIWDAANEYNHDFWKKIQKSRERCESECTDLAEHTGIRRDWLKGDEWDTVMEL